MDFVPLLVGAAMVAMLIDVVRSAKGGDWNEWPEDLRVREYPVAVAP